MLKQSLLAACVAGSAMSVAGAADLPARRAPPAFVPPPPPVFSWTGAYVGVNAGYAFSDAQIVRTAGNNGPGANPVQPPFNTNTVNNVATSRRPAAIGLKQDGFTGGGQIGYNYQFGQGLSGIVVGVEADAAYTDMRRTTNFLSFANDPSAFRSRLDFLGTVRGRFGYAFDRVLIYGTGGFAYGGVNSTALFFSNGAGSPLAYSGRSNRIETGYAFGGGVEYALPTASFLNVFNSSAVTLRAEYIHYDLGTRSVLVNATGNAPANGSYTSRFKTEGNIVRAGLNFKLGAVPMAPVVARY